MPLLPFIWLHSWRVGERVWVAWLRAYKTDGLPEPEYGTDGGFVWITFMRPNSVTNHNTNPNGTQQLLDKRKEVLAFCIVPSSSREILNHIRVTYQYNNIVKFINRLIWQWIPKDSWRMEGGKMECSNIRG